jgi:hypothetical protein
MPDITLRQLHEFLRAVDGRTWVGDGTVWIAAMPPTPSRTPFPARATTCARSHCRPRRARRRRHDPELYDRARTALRARGFDADTQTRIALFLGSAKNMNAAIFAWAELQPQVTVAYPFIHGQYFREVEFASLLARVTRWSANAALYMQAAALPAAVARVAHPTPPGRFDAHAAYAALRFGMRSLRA